MIIRVHNILENSEIGKMYKESELKQYEVSVEENEFPPSFEEIQKIMIDKKGESVDGHGKDTQNPF